MLSASVISLSQSQLAINEFNGSISAFLYCQILRVYDRLKLCFWEIAMHVALWSLMCASIFNVYASINSALYDARIANEFNNNVSYLAVTRVKLANSVRSWNVFCVDFVAVFVEIRLLMTFKTNLSVFSGFFFFFGIPIIFKVEFTQISWENNAIVLSDSLVWITFNIFVGCTQHIHRIQKIRTEK